MDDSSKPSTKCSLGLNGVGPNWAPLWFNKRLTQVFEYFFTRESWIAHDTAYDIGGNEDTRLCADYIFLLNMLASLNNHSILKKIIGVPIAYCMFSTVVLFGPLSFNYKGKNKKC